jgi:hypothetical protein
MSNPQQDFGFTSNDLLESLIAEHNSAVPSCQIVEQSAEDAQSAENSPVVNIGICNETV